MYESIFKAKLKEIEEHHLTRSLEKPSALEFQHNDYLGLSQHPDLKNAVATSVEVTGTGSRGSRLLGGNSTLFEETEEKIARFFRAPAALLFSSGYMANLGVMQVLGECVEEIYSDEKNHASLIDGIRLTQKKKHLVPHQKWETVSAGTGAALFVTESLFSMDGDLLNKKAFENAAKVRNAFCHVDEAHAVGVLMEEGKGLPLAVGWEKLSKTVTFGKAFGVSGAAVLTSPALKALLINRARSFIFSTAPAPMVAVGIQKALELAEEEAWRREELWSRAEKVREILGNFVQNASSVWERRVPILIVPLHGEERALSLARNMREFGFDIRAIRYPTVPRGEERLRLTLNLQVSRENTETMAEFLRQKLEEARNS